MSESLYWTWLSLHFGANSGAYSKLLETFNSAYEVYAAADETVRALDGFNMESRAKLCDKDLTAAQKLLEKCRAANIGVLTITDNRYPSKLRNIKNPPVVLYYLGQLFDLDRVCIGVVGTRTMSDYGREVSYHMGYTLAAGGACVVSGMALGNDGMSAAGALDAKGKTVAVLGCGVDVVYPREHAKLMRAIAKDGLVISEYPPGTVPYKNNFPDRNRIISGLCDGVVVTECDIISGAMITARNCIRHERELFAVPGSVFSKMSQGTNQLISDGAKLVSNGEDVLLHYAQAHPSEIDVYAISPCGFDSREAQRRYGISTKTSGGGVIKKLFSQKDDAARENKTARENNEEKSAPARDELVVLTPVQKQIFDRIPDTGSISKDILLRMDGVDAGMIMSALTMLEIKGLIEGVPGGAYIKKLK